MWIWNALADQRRQLVSLLDRLDGTQWHTPSLCKGWRVREVVGHIVTPFETSMPSFFLRLMANRFSIDKTLDRVAKELSRCPTSELTSVLRLNIDNRLTPPGIGPEGGLADLVIHTQDICRPLGVPPILDEEKARFLLDQFIKGDGRRFFNPVWRALRLTPKPSPSAMASGFHLVAEDLDWSMGDGPDVRGTGEALLMCFAGRHVALVDLKGEGVDQLRAKLGDTSFLRRFER